MSSAYKLLAIIAACLAAGSCAAAPALRVCADPHNLPYSDKQHQGFENQIAKLISADLGVQVSYFWYRQVEKFFSRTLNSGNCDVVMGVPEGFQGADVTRPYYRSSYVFVSRSADHLRIRSFDDPRMKKLRIGVHVFGESEDSVPPVYSLASRGIVRNVISYNVLNNGLSGDQSLQKLIRALGRNQIDIAIAWGPIAGYFARISNAPLTIMPIESDPRNPKLPFTFAIGIGVRNGDEQLKRQLDEELARRRAAISRVLERYGIPQVNTPSHVGTSVAEN